MTTSRYYRAFLTTFDGEDFVSLVLPANLRRWDLLAGQQAAIVADVQYWAMAKAVCQLEKRAHVSTFLGTRKSGHLTTFLGTSRQRGSRSGVSLKTQRRADTAGKAHPELTKRVELKRVELKGSHMT